MFCSIQKILWGLILKYRSNRPNLPCVLLSSLSSSSLRCIFIFAYTQMDLDNKTRGRKKCLFIYALGSTVPSYKSMRATQAWYLFHAVSLVSNLVSIKNLEYQNWELPLIIQKKIILKLTYFEKKTQVKKILKLTHFEKTLSKKKKF